MTFTKKAQLELGFNWIYMLVAGGVILLFFVGIVVKEKFKAEENLGQDLVRTMESLFTGAQVSEKTKNVIDIGGLADFTLYFDCEDQVTTYGLKETSARAENIVDPIFSPNEIKAAKMIAWSLPYNFPYKVADMLFVTSSNTKYFIYNPSNDGFTKEFLKATGNEFNTKKITTEQEYQTLDPGNNFQIRIIDISGQLIKSNKPLPLSLQKFDNNKVSAIVFTGKNTFDYYQKQGAIWTKKTLTPLRVISLSDERDAAKYAAIFAQDKEMYRCSMKKAFARMKYVTDIYQRKAETVIEHYSQDQTKMDQFTKSTASGCLGYYTENEPNIKSSLDSLSNKLTGCLNDPTFTLCESLIEAADKVKKANQGLSEHGDCIALY